MMSEKEDLLQRKKEVEQELESIIRRLNELDEEEPRSYEDGI